MIDVLPRIDSYGGHSVILVLAPRISISPLELPIFQRVLAAVRCFCFKQGTKLRGLLWKYGLLFL